MHALLRTMLFTSLIFSLSCKQETIFIDTLGTTRMQLGNTALNDIDFIGNRGMICGENKLLLISDDGTNWERVEHNAEGNFTKIRFVTPEIILATIFNDELFEYKQKLMISKDTGKTWEELIKVSDRHIDFKIVDESTWVLVDGIYIYITQDAGQSWNSNRLSYESTDPLAVCFFNSTTGYVVDRSNAVFYTNDGGNSWDKRLGNSFSSVRMLDGDEKLLVGFGQGAISYSRDQGFNWEWADVALTPISKTSAGYDGAKLICYDIEDNIVLASGPNSLFISTNSAGSFQEYMSKEGTSLSFNGLAISSNRIAYGVGQNGFLVKFNIP